ncbi:hypothetical protein BFR57_07310 [Idiomarina sp. MD25a]|uniref:hypothetical protein n=1 Tax=Idiomarina sp. MD25a TaxID=1889913 RepID=UPI0008F7FB3F|nr:hypothetical protein [Idiomarina sp. MD25a]OIN01856.1 hypothetical protein BFR57_07310 [Idiomarina sp. MD25a]
MRREPIIKSRELIARPLIKALLPIAERRGISAHQLLKGTHVFDAELKLSAGRSNEQDLARIVAAAEQLIGDAQLWPLVVQSLHQQRLCPAFDCIRYATTFNAALLASLRYQTLLHPFILVRPKRIQQRLHIDWLPVSGLPDKHNKTFRDACDKLMLALVIHAARVCQVNLSDWRIGVHDPKSLPVNWHTWISTIDSRPIPCLSFPLHQLPIQNPTASANDLQQAHSFAKLQCETLDAQAPLTEALFWMLKKAKQGDESSLEELSSALNMSASTCKRLLASQGMNFKRLADYARLKYFLYHSEAKPHTQAELAAKLGYSHPNNLRRARRRWLASF